MILHILRKFVRSVYIFGSPLQQRAASILQMRLGSAKQDSFRTFMCGHWVKKLVDAIAANRKIWMQKGARQQQ